MKIYTTVCGSIRRTAVVAGQKFYRFFLEPETLKAAQLGSLFCGRVLAFSETTNSGYVDVGLDRELLLVGIPHKKLKPGHLVNVEVIREPRLKKAPVGRLLQDQVGTGDPGPIHLVSKLEFFLRGRMDEPLEIVTDSPEECDFWKTRLAKIPSAKFQVVTTGLPLFDQAGLTKTINQLYEPTFYFSKAGSLSISVTEAAVCIDVNHGEFAFRHRKTGTELINRASLAAVAEQVALRNLSGNFLVDGLNPGSEGSAFRKTLIREAGQFGLDLSLYPVANMPRWTLFTRPHCGSSLVDVGRRWCDVCVQPGGSKSSDLVWLDIWDEYLRQRKKGIEPTTLQIAEHLVVLPGSTAAHVLSAIRSLRGWPVTVRNEGQFDVKSFWFR